MIAETAMTLASLAALAASVLVLVVARADLREAKFWHGEALALLDRATALADASNPLPTGERDE